MLQFIDRYFVYLSAELYDLFEPLDCLEVLLRSRTVFVLPPHLATNFISTNSSWQNDSCLENIRR